MDEGEEGRKKRAGAGAPQLLYTCWIRWLKGGHVKKARPGMGRSQARSGPVPVVDCRDMTILGGDARGSVSLDVSSVLCLS